MKVIFIGSDRSIFVEGSPARARMVEYGKLFEELHIIVFSTKRLQATPKERVLPTGQASYPEGKSTSYGAGKFQKISNSKFQIGENIWIYPTNSWSRWFYPFDGARIAKRIIKECSPNSSKLTANGFVVSAQDPFEAGLAGFWVKIKTGAKLHIQIHTDFLSPFFKAQSLLNIIRLRIAEKILPKADGIRVVSPRIKYSLLQATSYKLQAIPVVLPIFVIKKDLSNIFPYNYKKNHPNWTFVILSTGRFESEKNFELAIFVLKNITKKYPNTGLVLAGSGSLDKNLKSLSQSLALKNNVEFIDWQNDLTPFYFGADLYLQTSNCEGFGLSAVEAGYVGLPVVTTDVGAVGWVFKNNENSRVCPVGDEKCLSFEIIKMIEDNQIREQIIENLKNGFGKELIQSKEEYLQKYKESIENCFK